MGYVCLAIGLAFVGTGLMTIRAFRATQWQGEDQKVHDIEQHQPDQPNY
jgi:hypothetical protein